MNHHHLGPLGVLVVILCLLLTPLTAKADEIWSYGELSCNGNHAVLRFANASNTDFPVFPVMPSVTGQLRPLPLGATSCKLSDGTLVKFKLGDMQRYAHGMCGGGLNSFTSLWADERKVLSRQRVLSACFSEHYADIIILNGDKLLLCRSPESLEFIKMTDDDGTGCRDASHLLADAQHAPIEYPPDGAGSRTVGRIDIPFAEDGEWCAEFLADEKVDPKAPEALRIASLMESSVIPFVVTGTNIRHQSEEVRPPQADVNFRLPNDVTIFEFRSFTSGQLPAQWFEEEAFGYGDFDNDHVEDLVLRLTDDNNYLDGTLYYVPSGDADAQELKEVARKLSQRKIGAFRDILFDPEKPEAYTGPFPQFAPDYRDRYTYQVALRRAGETLVFATSLNRSVHPTAIVYRPRPGGEVEPVCVFQRVEENY